jgi:hypothetical protein
LDFPIAEYSIAGWWQGYGSQFPSATWGNYPAKQFTGVADDALAPWTS